jgi:Fe-S cluster assembly ATP-binding protein
MLKRPLNVGFSGGEKKRAEILQMKLLAPKLCVLDETDSGLDIDALKIVSDGVNALRSPDRAVIVITHYQRLLDYIVPGHVHVLYKGQVIKSGDKDAGARSGGQWLCRHHRSGRLNAAERELTGLEGQERQA